MYLLHQFDAVGPGQQQVQQHQFGPLRFHQSGCIPWISGHDRGVTELDKGVADVAEVIGVVVHREDSYQYL